MANQSTSHYRRPLQNKEHTATITNVKIEGNLLLALDRWIATKAPSLGRSDVVRSVLTEWLVQQGVISQDDDRDYSTLNTRLTRRKA